MSEPDRLVTEKRAAELLTVHIDTLRRMRRRGDIPYVQISPRRIGYRLGSIWETLGSNPVPTSAGSGTRRSEGNPHKQRGTAT